jgi:repressor LexA
MSKIKQALTKNQNKVFSFIKKYITEKKISPSISEIQSHFGYRSPRAVSDHLAILERKGHIKRGKKGQSRSILLIGEKEEIPSQENSNSNAVELIIAGKPSGGNPFSIFMNAKEKMFIDKKLLNQNQQYFIAKVGDNSLKKDGISEGDFAIIKQELSPENNSFAVAIFGDELIIRKIERLGNDGFNLISGDKRFPNLNFESSDNSVSLIGELAGIIRSYLKQ